jgi:hypothetical protein
MKPEAERAIRTLDELITWLAKKHIVNNQAALDRLTAALKVVAENCEHDNAEHDAEMNAMAERSHKKDLLLRCCGFTLKGIGELLEYEIDDLEDFIRFYNRDKNALPLNHPLSADFFRIETRIKYELKNQ